MAISLGLNKGKVVLRSCIEVEVARLVCEDEVYEAWIKT